MSLSFNVEHQSHTVQAIPKQFPDVWPPNRIAVVRALQLGDLLQAVPAFRSLRRGFPNAEITLVGLPWARGFVDRFSQYIDRFVEFPGYPGIVEAPYHPSRTFAFFAGQHAEQYDLAVQMHGSGRTSNAFTHGLGAKVTAGFHDEHATRLLTITERYPDDLLEARRNLRLVRLLGCDDSDTRLEFPLYHADVSEASTLLSGIGPRPWVGMHTGARAPARRWPLERFTAIARSVLERYGGTVLLTGGPDEHEYVAQVGNAAPNSVVNIAGRTSLGGLAAVISQLDLFLSNDTGPAHIAQAAGTPSVTIFGPADPQRWAPLDQERHRIVHRPVHCSPCGYWECPIDHRCLRWIETRDVMNEIDELLTSGRKHCIA